MKLRQIYINFFWIFAVFFAAIVVIIPIFYSGFITTDDGNWMIIRLSAFYQSLREGQFPVRFLGRLNNSYGYPVSNFLYPGYLYIGSLLHGIGFSFVDAVKIILGGSVIIGGVFIYLWLKTFTSGVSAFIGTLSYLFAPYLLFDIYKRGSVGEVLAMTCAAASLYALERKKHALLTPAIFLLILSHNSLALLFALYVLSILIIRKNIYGLVSFAIGVGMATFFWFPALYEKMYVRFDSITISNPYEYFVQGKLSYLFSISAVFALCWFIAKRPKNISNIYMAGYIGSTLLATSLSRFLWGIEGFSRLFQFPFRMLSLSTVLGAYLVAIMVEKNSKKLRLFIMVAIVLISFWQIRNAHNNIARTNYPEGYYATNEATTTIRNEYMPKWAREIPQERPAARMVFEKGRGTIQFFTATTQRIEAKVFAEEDSILQINSIYYPGWGVLVNNIPTNISYDNPHGLIQFSLTSGSHTVLAEFRETIPRFIANCFSIFSFGLYIFFIVSIRRKNSNQK
jgi:hypothetical protein